MLVRISERSFASVASSVAPGRAGRGQPLVSVQLPLSGSWLIWHEAMVYPPLAVAVEMTWPFTSILHETGAKGSRPVVCSPPR